MRWMLLTIVVVTSACGASVKRGEMPSEPLAEVSANELYRTGLAYSARQNFVRAEQYFIAAIAKGMSEHKVIPKIMQSCVLSNRLESAVVHGEGYISKFPSAMPMRLLLASIYLETENYGAARGHLLLIRESDPDMAEAAFLLGRAELAIGAKKRARRQFAAYLQKQPNGEGAPFARAQLGSDKKPRRVSR